MKLDLNCDLGEGEPLSRTRALMRWITSANVACGGHAGNARSMETCVRMAKHYHVRLGAHPGPSSRGDFGRGRVDLTPDEFELLLLQQVGALETIVRRYGMKLHHVKLHGGLYHASEANSALGWRYVEAARRWWPRASLYVLAGGSVERIAMRAGVETWGEAFVDRNYLEDGSLVSRDDASALFTNVWEVRKRVRLLLEKKTIRSASGLTLNLRPRTLCLHSDTPGAVVLARAVAELIRAKRTAH